MWPFSSRKKRTRQTALNEACQLLTKQIHSASEIDQFFEKAHNKWALGYCFGMLQASLESSDISAKLTDSDYQDFISTGLGAVYANEIQGLLQYRIGLSSMNNTDFHDGLLVGATEYVQVVNAKGNIACGLSRYLISAQLHTTGV